MGRRGLGGWMEERREREKEGGRRGLGGWMEERREREKEGGRRRG